MPELDVIRSSVTDFIRRQCEGIPITNLVVTCGQDALFFVPSVMEHGPIGATRYSGAMPFMEVDGDKPIKPIRAGVTFMLNVLNYNVKSKLIYFMFSENGNEAENID